jgi:hypothetical protein
LALLAAGILPGPHRENVWSIAVYEGPTPFQLAAVAEPPQPVLAATDVTDVPALFVADPFVLKYRDRWHLFCEVLNCDSDQGDIGLATSPDGLRWQYERIVLDEPFHLSYPLVFAWGDHYYMLPETHQAGGIRLYRAAAFPDRWQYVRTLVRGERLADPTLFRHGDTWWLFVGATHTHHSLRLFFSDRLKEGWSEHPQSPVVVDDPAIARPGGPVLWVDGRGYRLGQDCRGRYGRRLRAFEITRLTRTEYAERPFGDAPLLRASGRGWNAAGMHHCAAVELAPGHWRALVDGHRKVWQWKFLP